uniref:Uncharacterized protein n=1 Tax=Arundo donax TaxID=35708 RepID=A0A0A8YBU5_ARUDO
MSLTCYARNTTLEMLGTFLRHNRSDDLLSLTICNSQDLDSRIDKILGQVAK